MQLPGTSQPAPAHVPPALIRPDFPLNFGATTKLNPFTDLIDKLHETTPPVFYAPHAYPGGAPAWIVRRAASLRDIYFDPERFSSADFAPFAKLIGEKWSNLPAEKDPPLHRLYRNFVNPLFTPKAMAALDGKIRHYAREYVASFKDKGECEFMSEFSFEFPIKVFMELMGLPLDRTKEFLEWEMGLLHNHELAGIRTATRNVVAYLDAEIEARRANPTEDLISYGVHAEFDGRKLDRDELIGFTFNLFIGGLDTVSTNMGLQFWHLATHPEDQARLRAEPALIGDAISELMRAYPAVTTFRTCVQQVEVEGVTMMPGDRVAMSTSLAGRDPSEYEAPHVVDLDRKPRQLSFGYGPHVCVGMHLARRELRIAMEEMLATLPEFRLKEGTEMEFRLGGMIQPKAVLLAW
ncbi:cytochrome P450 [Novosphingobium sp. BL-52-GroH]|uniref:cytochrome P450 n=1 Tax=Novosphingobium sp. BL-52-GroH TaxID=3349877 RepID=UPI00385109FB